MVFSGTAGLQLPPMYPTLAPQQFSNETAMPQSVPLFFVPMNPNRSHQADNDTLMEVFCRFEPLRAYRANYVCSSPQPMFVLFDFGVRSTKTSARLTEKHEVISEHRTRQSG